MGHHYEYEYTDPKTGMKLYVDEWGDAYLEGRGVHHKLGPYDPETKTLTSRHTTIYYTKSITSDGRFHPAYSEPTTCVGPDWVEFICCQLCRDGDYKVEAERTFTKKQFLHRRPVTNKPENIPSRLIRHHEREFKDKEDYKNWLKKMRRWQRANARVPKTND